MNRDSAKAPIEELRGKENTHANKKKNKQDYERKNRKQEQYVNLEKKTGQKSGMHSRSRRQRKRPMRFVALHFRK